MMDSFFSPASGYTEKVAHEPVLSASRRPVPNAAVSRDDGPGVRSGP